MVGPGTLQPILLVGAEQSGTTLLRLMLDSHPEVAFAEEFHYAVDPIDDHGAFPSLADFRAQLSLDRAFADSGFRFDPSLSFEDMVNGFLLSRQRRKSALVVGATIHHGFSKALALWPEARFLHLVRDPRDVAADRMDTGLAGNSWHGVAHWIRAEDEWNQLLPRIDPCRALTVRFDELIGDHHSTLTRICRFAGVDYTGQMLNYTEDTDYREPNPNLAGDWRDRLSTRDVQLVETRVGDRLVRAGFEPSGNDALAITGRYLGWLRWHDRAGRVAGRLQRFGVRLTVAEMAARATGNRSLQRSMQLRFNEAELEQRKKSWSDAKYRTSR